MKLCKCIGYRSRQVHPEAPPSGTPPGQTLMEEAVSCASGAELQDPGAQADLQMLPSDTPSDEKEGEEEEEEEEEDGRNAHVTSWPPLHAGVALRASPPQQDSDAEDWLAKSREEVEAFGEEEVLSWAEAVLRAKGYKGSRGDSNTAISRTLSVFKINFVIGAALLELTLEKMIAAPYNIPGGPAELLAKKIQLLLKEPQAAVQVSGDNLPQRKNEEAQAAAGKQADGQAPPSGDPPGQSLTEEEAVSCAELQDPGAQAAAQEVSGDNQQDRKKGEESEPQDYDLQNMSGLLAFLRDANVRLVRPQFLRELHQAGRAWPRRQEAETARTASGETALLSHDELEQKAKHWQAFSILSFSHCWEAKEHPDPLGYQLSMLVEALQAFPAELTRRLNSQTGPLLSLNWDAAVFIDYVSLHQFQRSEAEEPYFQAAMRGMHTLYCHDCTFTLRLEDLTPTEWAPPREAVSLYSARDRCVCSVPLAKLHAPPAHQGGQCPATCDWPLHPNNTPYTERGWCAAEQQWSLSRANSWHSMRLPLGTPEICEAPLTPEAFADAVRAGGLKFTHRGDAEPVLRLQRHVFESKTAVTTYLDLNHLGPDGVRAAADCLPHCRRLTELKLTRSSVGDEGAQVLARGLETCSPLELLWLFENSIGDNGCKALAAALAGHRGLRELSLGANGFGDAGAEALGAALRQMPRLQELQLNQNQIGGKGAQALARGLEGTTALELLWLSANHIGDPGCQALAAALAGHRGLRELHLAANGFGDAGAEALGAALRQMPRLQTLRLNQNQIGGKGAQALARGLEGTTALQLLWLWGNQIGDPGCQALAAALAGHRGLRDLNLDANGFGDAGAEALGVALRQMPRLQDLRLQQNQIGVKGAQALAHGLEGTTALELLWLVQNQIGDAGCQALAAALAGHRGLRELSLAANGFGDAGAEALANGLQYHTRLEDVRLFENSIGEVGCKALANVLSKQKKLRVLNLRTNHLGDAGAEALGNALAQMSSLQELRLQQNAITDAGAQALARNLQHTALRELWLSENEIGDLGCQALAAAIEQLPLHTLHLEKNSIGESGAHALVKGLQHKSLESVHVQENCIDGPGCEALQQLRIKDLRCEDQQDRSLTR